MTGFELLSAIASGVTIFGFFFIAVQVWQVSRSARSAALSAIYSHARDVRQVLVDHPELRPYVTGAAPIDSGHEHYSAARTVAEMQLNYFEHLVIQRRYFSRINWKAWRPYIEASLRCSPFLRRVLEDRRDFYSRHLLDIAGMTARSRTGPGGGAK